MTVADAPWWQARRLLRSARTATLATFADGQPHAALVTPATAPDGSVLLLLSDLAQHTRQLRANPQCALLVAGEPTGPNPQTTPRLTLGGHMIPAPDPALKARWLAIHSYAAFYAAFTDFHLWRLMPDTAWFVGGFAKATAIDPTQLIAPIWPVTFDGEWVAADADGVDWLQPEGGSVRQHWPMPITTSERFNTALAALKKPC